MADYERILCVKQEVFVYRIPPLQNDRGHRAADWKLDAPDWTGRLRVVALDKEVEIRLEDKASGQLFAKCPVDKYPGINVEPVTDSSRYFVLRLVNDNGQTAFIGIGFADRGDSFDLNVAMQDHFKYLEKSDKIEKEANEELNDPNQPKLDLAFKEGQTISISIGGKESTRTRPRAKPEGSAPVPLLPPPPPSAGGGRSRTAGGGAGQS